MTVTVACRMNSCPYNKQGFCGKGLTTIDSNGMCEVFWKNGQRRQPPRNIGKVDDFVILNEKESQQ